MRSTSVKKILVFSLFLVIGTFASAQTSGEEQIRNAEQSLAVAEGHNDSGPYKRIMANDWVALTPDGIALQREEVVRNIADHEGQGKPYVVKLADVRIDLFGQTAVCSFVREYHGTVGEAKDRVIRESVVHVFTKESGQWKLHYEKSLPLRDGANS